MMKKTLALLLVMVMLFSLAACGQNTDANSAASPTGGNEDSSNTNPPTAPTDPLRP